MRQLFAQKSFSSPPSLRYATVAAMTPPPATATAGSTTTTRGIRFFSSTTPRRATTANKTAIITGSTSGIGLGIARAFAKKGVATNIVINGFGDAATIEQERAELERVSAGGAARVIYSGADVTKRDDIRAMVAEAERCFGTSVDILVNNAGIQHVASIEDFPVEKWNAVLATNLSSMFHATQAVLPGMRARGWGRILNTASALGIRAIERKAAYVAAKHGVVGLTKTIALETANDGITCNAICPAWVLTPLAEKQFEARAKAEGCSVEEMHKRALQEVQPMIKFTEAEHIGELMGFLCTDAAATITGIPIPVDGGLSARA